MGEHPLWARDRVGNGEEILTYFIGFCVATNYDKLSDTRYHEIRWNVGFMLGNVIETPVCQPAGRRENDFAISSS
jgi:hypothetical protein